RERGHDERRSEEAQLAEVGARGHDEQDETERGVRALPFEVADGVAVPERGGRGRRAVHHHEAEEGQRNGDEDEQLPFERMLRARPAHARASTSRRNASPRSSKFANWS